MRQIDGKALAFTLREIAQSHEGIRKALKDLEDNLHDNLHDLMASDAELTKDQVEILCDFERVVYVGRGGEL